ncbi:MAG: diaminopimelate epimerase [Bifidobacteriaceae bacterium]|nr:diaminopimelate epimerase [Bifidobacteriaceae bacterium]
MTLPSILTKGHATANDFVIFADPTGSFDPTPEEVAAICDRHRGIGGDGLIRLTRPEYVADLSVIQKNMLRGQGAEWFMDYRNADGSLAEMCGNGTRLTARFAQSLGEMGTEIGSEFKLATRAGVKTLIFRGEDSELGKDVFTVRMGGWSAGEIGEYSVTIPGVEGVAAATFADLGNPHVVSVVGDRTGQFSERIPSSSLPDVEDLDLSRTPVVSPRLESGQNAEFVRIDTASAIDIAGTATMRVNERGVGETLSCGTGLCATAIVLRKLTGIDNWTITVRGGILRVEVSDSDVSLTGASRLVGAVSLIKK